VRLEKSLLKSILTECNKLIARHHRYHNSLHLEHERNKKRIRDALPKRIEIPSYWESSNLFNPFYVKKRAESIARSIARKIESQSYMPHSPYSTTIPKKDGGTRNISVYEIPDAAVSNYLFYSLMNKNKHRFSSFSYAYQQDRNVHFAIQDIVVELQRQDRLFISEFDFSDFFGSIKHSYLFQQFFKNGFLISKQDENIIRQFLSIRKIGISQGTSLSLFLANLSCWKLDRAFENEGLRFARYADDTVVWSKRYDKICKSYEIIKQFSDETGININLKKSDGISLLLRPGVPSEFDRTKYNFNFLGYCISVDKVSIRDESVMKIKAHISYLLYRNLIQPINGSVLRSVEVPNRDDDRDLFVAIQQIRRYLYGNLTDQLLEDYTSGKIGRLTFKGLMSFYPLVTDEEQLKTLDGWMVHTVYHAVKKRLRLFENHRITVLRDRFPFKVSQDDLVDIFAHKFFKRTSSNYRLPSFMRIYRAIKRGVIDDGLGFTDAYY